MQQKEKVTNEMLGFVEDEYGALRIDDITIPPPPTATLSHDIPDKRLIVTELRIKNFKSYANEVILGPFNKNFTAVVGPNGSGKSNVIDSLLFVFGYRAKKIRSKKVSHLIHKSDQHPNVNSCSVTVKFAMIAEQGDEYDIIPGTEFVLSRTAFSDDSSYYEISKKRVAYKEVVKALCKYGIDLEHSRFLILQGEIEAISLMQPKGPNEHETGMLEYIEDIIGSNRYIEPIEKFKVKLEKLNEEKNAKLNILKLVEKDRDSLEEPRRKAINFLRLENKAITYKNSLLQCQRKTLEKELSEIVESKKTLSDQLNKLKEHIHEVQMSRKVQEKDLEKINSEYDSHLKDCEAYKDAYKSLERQDVAIHEEIKHLKSKRQKLESSLTAAQNELVKLQKQGGIFEKETIELDIMKKKLEAEKLKEEKNLAEVLDTVQQDTRNLQENKDKLETQLIKIKSKVHQSKSEMELLQSELDLYLRNSTQGKQSLSTLQTNFKNAEKSVKDEAILLEKETAEIASLSSELRNLKSEIIESQQKEVLLSENLRKSRAAFEEAKSSVHNFRSRSGVMQAFAKEKACGRLTGVYGRLGDLGAIEEKYDVAISTACGALDQIVTDTLKTAEECIKFLKENNLGYVTFIPLERMVDYQHFRRNVPTPESVPRLFDLIQVKDPKLLPAFYYAVRETLVAATLDQATRIALQGSKRHRVVTLKGEVIDQSGTMTGGGGRVFRGRMGQTVVECNYTPAEVQKMGSEVNDLTRKLSEIRQQITDAQEQMCYKSKKLSALQLSVKKRQSNCKAYVTSVEMLKSQIEKQELKIKETVIDQKKVKELEDNIAVKKKSYDACVKEATVIEEKVSRLQAEILKTTKGTLSKGKKTVDQLSKKIVDIFQSITKSTVNMKTNKRNIKKVEEKIKNVEKEFENAKEAKENLNASRDSTVQKAREFLDKQQHAQEGADKLKEKRAELKKKLEMVNEKEHKLKMEEGKQKNDLKEWEASEGKKRAAFKSLSTKLSHLKLNTVEDDSTELPTLSAEELKKISTSRLADDILVIETQMDDMKRDVNLSAIEKYDVQEKLCRERQKDLDTVVHDKNMQTLRHDELRKRRLSEFMAGFTAIAKKLKEIYQMLTLGGDAEMELVDSFDPFSKGIEFSVRPPKKSWKFMRNLSGGEKTLSSLALVFALHYYRPTPFYVMDEIDAALDVRNVAIVGYYLKERTKNCQFIIVSLRNIMNELSDHLIGIYKTDNCSKNISLMNVGKWKDVDERH